MPTSEVIPVKSITRLHDGRDVRRHSVSGYNVRRVSERIYSVRKDDAVVGLVFIRGDSLACQESRRFPRLVQEAIAPAPPSNDEPARRLWYELVPTTELAVPPNYFSDDLPNVYWAWLLHPDCTLHAVERVVQPGREFTRRAAWHNGAWGEWVQCPQEGQV